MKEKGYWTYERCKEAAFLCETKGEFIKRFVSAYNASKRLGFFDEITNHMKLQGNYFKRVIYSYKFPDNHVYVGLTCRKKRRHKSHMGKDDKSPVFIHMKKTGLLPKLKYLTDFLPYYDAQKEEKHWVEKYKNMGWYVLNRTKCGGLGSNKIIWTKEKCQKEAIKYNTRKEFANNSNSAYRSSLRNNWLNNICKHMGDKVIKRNYWNYTTCKKVANLCSTRFEFSRKYSRAYTISLENKWIDEFIPQTKK